MKNDFVLINFISRGSGGMLPLENFLMFQPLRLASEHSDRENLSVIPLLPLYFKSNVVRMWDMSPTARSTKL